MNRLLDIPTSPVADIELPREFDQLYELAYNLWWTWTPEARDLFAAIDSAHWAQYRNPVQLLINVEPRHWYSLLDSERFRRRYHQVIEQFADYLATTDQSWFARTYPEQRGPFSYLSMEYGLDHALAIYSGGLGVLSGDHCKSASDLGVPLIACGLLYRHGYFQQTIDADGFQQHTYPELDFCRLPIRPVASTSGREVLVSIPLPGREVAAKVWLAQVGRVPLLLLDTDVPENHPADRPITNQLYVRGREMRLVQELVLGRGSVAALRRLDIQPRVWHLNEGHCAFAQLERWRQLPADLRNDCRAAADDLARTTVFTTHTPVAAGNEQFDTHLVEKYTRAWCDEVGIETDQLTELGRGNDADGSNFNLTALALRTSSRANGVSRINAEVATEMWRQVLDQHGHERIEPITNGVHTETWIGREIRSLLRNTTSSPFSTDELLANNAAKLDSRQLWRAHTAQKERLGRFLRARLRQQKARHGASPDELRAVDALFDPRALTIGFARRFATYKRARLVFSEIERLQAMLSDPARPVQLIFAGKAHPADRPGQELIQQIFGLSRSASFEGRVFFLENYDMRMGRMLVQGVDVWLNTPRRPLEASGTSGQKAALNGALNFSVLDGWWPEGYDGENGWKIGDDHRSESAENESESDARDSQSLYETLESHILPRFFERDADDIPIQWAAMMKSAITSLGAPFSAARMVRDYVDRIYVPTLTATGETAPRLEGTEQLRDSRQF